MFETDTLTNQIAAAAIEVHKALGPGLHESVYAECLCRELSLRSLNFQRNCDLPVLYKGQRLDCGYRIDLLVENSVIVQILSVDELTAADHAKLKTFLRLAALRSGLLLNFNVPVLREHMVRVVL